MPHQPHTAVVVLVADGVRPDTLRDALDRGDLPAFARMRAGGGLHTVTSTFPSVTGPAYAPFVMGRFPGPVGLPGLRWFDRARVACSFPDYTRSYVGFQMPAIDRDIDVAAPTMFELVPDSLAALNMIGRGLRRGHRIDRISLRSVVRTARTHFRGNVGGWLELDARVGDEVVRRVSAERPRFTFAAFTGVDKTSHQLGHGAPMVVDALKLVDHAAGRLLDAAERSGDRLHLWIVSDHGHSPVRQHEDLAGLVAQRGHRTIAHPWVYARNPEVAVMVSGNAMAQLYLELAARERPWWPQLQRRWQPLAEALLARESVDLLLLPHSPTRCEVRSRERGRAWVERAAGRYRYSIAEGDPLGLGRDLDLSADESYEATVGSDYPDALVQISHLAGAPRAGEMILSAARDWDLRSKWEPIPHVSSHGALHREHMLVPLLVNHPVARLPRRTVDVMPSALTALGLPLPPGLDGTTFVG